MIYSSHYMDEVLLVFLFLQSWNNLEMSPLEVGAFSVHGKRNYVFFVDSTVPGGGNLILKILCKVLNNIGERNELSPKNPTLYLQFDKCGENKNKTMFAFLVDLV